ncbi:MAG TPA: hypothetical protein VMV69_02475 [Pirellulales bacterium]|nr:hypothetical protein [Pirellulales bacterium]
MSRKVLSLFVATALFGGVALSQPGAEGGKPDATAGQRLKLAREVYAEKMELVKNREGYDIEDLELWSQNLLGAELAVAGKPAERTAAHEAHVERAKELEKLARAYQRAGQGRNSDALAAEFYRLQAEARLAENQP